MVFGVQVLGCGVCKLFHDAAVLGGAGRSEKGLKSLLAAVVVGLVMVVVIVFV